MSQDCQLIQQEEPVADSFTSETEKAHGRIEPRTVQVWRDLLATAPQWQGLFADVICLQRTRKVFHTKTKQWQLSQENAFFLSTCSLTAEDYMKHIRNHSLYRKP